MFNVLKAFIASSQNDCNRAKSSATGRLQIPLVYFAPAVEIFYPIKTVYPTRRWFCTARWCGGVVSFGEDVCFSAGFFAAVVFFVKYRCTLRDTSSVGFTASFSSRRSHFALPCNATFTPPQVGFHLPKGDFTCRRQISPREAGFHPSEGRSASSVSCADSFSSRRSHIWFALRCNASFMPFVERYFMPRRGISCCR